jgi:FKBP-type peptidyl-prolyl cis-trans isomerase (trigger factor)
MDIDITETGRTFFTRDFAVVVPEALVKERVGYEIEDVGRVYKRPGFRVGHVPASIIDRHLGAAIRTRMIDGLVEYAVARTTRGMCLIGEPETEVLSISGDIELTVSVKVRPELPCPCGTRGLKHTASLPAYYGAMGPLNAAAVSDFCARTIGEIDKYWTEQRAS